MAAALMLAAPAGPASAAEADTQAPTTPGPIVATEVTTSSVTLVWQASTDDVGVTGYQVVRQDTDMLFLTETTTNSITITGLRASWTYRFNVYAFDAAGNRSTSPPRTTVTMAPGDVSPPSVPGTPVVTAAGATTLALKWAPSTDNVLLNTYEVFGVFGGTTILLTRVFQYPLVIAETTLTGLAPATTYTIAVRARDDAGNVSALSGTVTATTGSSTTVVDTTPPTAPGTPTVSEITSTGVTLTWAAATDDTAITRYVVANLAASPGYAFAWATTTSVNLTGLEPNTRYVLAVQAVDAAGNRSQPSGQVVVTTLPLVPPCCSVTFRVVAQWQGGFQAEVTIKNISAYPVNGWTICWTFPGGQRISQLWGATATSTGERTCVTNPPWAPTLPPGGSYSFGFIGTWTGTNSMPTAVTVNGLPAASG